MKKSTLPPTILIIFGVTGDLSRAKLLPALYELEKDGQLPEQFHIFGTSRQELDSKAITKLFENIKVDDKVAFKRLVSRLKTVRFDISLTDDYHRLRIALESFEMNKGCFNLLLYLAVPPDLVQHVVTQLASDKLNRACSDTTEVRLLIEKPFGTDLASAKSLVKHLQRSFKERQIYRIDHYLAKETVQNILTIRNDNPWLKSLWSAKHIKAIDITAFEQIGAEWRTTFYEQTGALRDMVQSHLLQLLAVTTMSMPGQLNEETIPRARLELLKTLRPLGIRTRKQATRAQYKGYRKEVGNSKSLIETFASVPIVIDQAAWRNTQVRLITGKSLDKKETRINVLFSDFAKKDEHQNILSFRIQPEEGVGITLATRKPGTIDEPEHLTLNYTYPDHVRLPNAYESVLLSVLKGDRTLFPTSDEVLACWKVINPLLKKWSRSDRALMQYKPGTKPHDIIARS